MTIDIWQSEEAVMGCVMLWGTLGGEEGVQECDRMEEVWRVEEVEDNKGEQGVLISDEWLLE